MDTRTRGTWDVGTWLPVSRILVKMCLQLHWSARTCSARREQSIDNNLAMNQGGFEALLGC